MAQGPGKYAEEAAKLLMQHKGELCLIMMVGGTSTGFDVATINPALLNVMPQMLRQMADDIDRELVLPGGISAPLVPGPTMPS